MARTLVDPGIWDPSTRFGTNGTVDADARAEVTRIRDLFRTELDPDSNATNWLVSDIFRWTGVSSKSAYGFEVFHMDGQGPSSKTGPSWLFMWSGAGFSTPLEFDEYTQNNRTTYFVDNTGGASFSLDGAIAFIYNATGGTTTPFDTGLQADGSLAGGDYSLSASSPYTALATFIPSGLLKGIATNSTLTAVYDQSRYVFVFDEEKPFVAIYSTRGREMTTRSIMVLGELLVPYRTADTFKSCILTLDLNTTNGGSITSSYIEAYNSAGNVVEYQPYYHEYFSSDNVPFDDDTYPWDLVSIASGTDVKGWLDSDIIRVMGPFARRINSQYDGGLFIKYQEALVFPYVALEPAFPYANPTVD